MNGMLQVKTQIKTLVLSGKPLIIQQLGNVRRSSTTIARSAIEVGLSVPLFDELMNLVCRFVSTSEALHTVILDSISTFQGKHFKNLGLFLAKSRTGMLSMLQVVWLWLLLLLLDIVVL